MSPAPKITCPVCSKKLCRFVVFTEYSFSQREVFCPDNHYRYIYQNDIYIMDIIYVGHFRITRSNRRIFITKILLEDGLIAGVIDVCELGEGFPIEKLLTEDSIKKIIAIS